MVLNFPMLICHRLFHLVVVLQGHLWILIDGEPRSADLNYFLACILRSFCQVLCLLDRPFSVSFLTRVPVALTNLISLFIEQIGPLRDLFEMMGGLGPLLAPITLRGAKVSVAPGWARPFPPRRLFCLIWSLLSRCNKLFPIGSRVLFVQFTIPPPLRVGHWKAI